MSFQFSILERVKPKLVVDKREKKPLLFTRLPFAIGHLETGDYSIVGAEHLFAVERRSVEDLFACASERDRERFDRALQRLGAFRFRRLLVVGPQTPVMDHEAARHLLLIAETRSDVPVPFAATPERAALMVEKWAYWLAKPIVETARQIASVNGTERPSPEGARLPATSPTMASGTATPTHPTRSLLDDFPPNR